MTRNLKCYLAFSIGWSVVFFAMLGWALTEPVSRWPFAAGGGIIYGLGFALGGYLLGRPDDQSKVRYNLGYAYAAVSNIASAVVGTIWIILFRPSGLVGVPVYLAVIAVFGIAGVAMHRKSIKGISAEDIFQ